MPIKLSKVTREDVVSVALPTNGNYSPVSHLEIMTITEKLLAMHNLSIAKAKNEELLQFVGANGNEIVAAYYVLDTQANSDLEMIFCWVNSYNRSIKFRCAVGCRIKGTNSVIIPEFYTVSRNTGHLKSEIETLILNLVKEAHLIFNKLVEEMNAFSLIGINRKALGSTLGVLFFDMSLFTAHQASSLHKTLSEDFSDPLIEWDMKSLYELIAVTSYNAHPKVWLDVHSKIHQTLLNMCDVSVPVESIEGRVIGFGENQEEIHEVPDTAVPEEYNTNPTPTEDPVATKVEEEIVEKEEPVKDVLSPGPVLEDVTPEVTEPVTQPETTNTQPTLAEEALSDEESSDFPEDEIDTVDESSFTEDDPEDEEEEDIVDDTIPPIELDDDSWNW